MIKADTIRFWKKGGIEHSTLHNPAFTNWAAGGENAMSATALLSVYAIIKRKKRPGTTLSILLMVCFKAEKLLSEKMKDKIDFSTKYGRQIKETHWYYSALINLKVSLMQDTIIPMTLMLFLVFITCICIGWQLDLIINRMITYLYFISPVTSKTTIVNDPRLADAGAYGVEKAEYDSLELK